MRQLHTMVCAGFLAGCSPAQAQSSVVHPELQNRPPREVTNSTLLALSDRERQAWVHGAMVQMVTVIATNDSVSARCVADWYFTEGNGLEQVGPVMEKYPEAPASATLLSLARRACPDL